MRKEMVVGLLAVGSFVAGAVTERGLASRASEVVGEWKVEAVQPKVSGAGAGAPAEGATMSWMLGGIGRLTKAEQKVSFASDGTFVAVGRIDVYAPMTVIRKGRWWIENGAVVIQRDGEKETGSLEMVGGKLVSENAEARMLFVRG